jgi:thiosulfate/3-mercaptopyruvate sulfurtransferase
MIISHTWLVEHLNDPNVVILDSRGNVAYSYAHIPNSQPLGVEKVITSNQYGGMGQQGFLFKEKEEMEKFFEEQKIPNDKKVVCYCVLGHRAAYVFTQLKIAGYKNVKLYDGSFADWVGRRLPLG